MKFRVLVDICDDGRFVAAVPSLPGCETTGPTRRAALGRVRKAIVQYLSDLEAPSLSRHHLLSSDCVEVNL